MFSKISLSAIRRYLVTLAVVLVALFIGWRLWIHYENDPWTRGRSYQGGCRAGRT